jgi:hypothetical protein
MRKVSEYREHADECLAMSRRIADPEQKKQLLDMAHTWTMLADEREAHLARQAKMSPFNHDAAKDER